MTIAPGTVLLGTVALEPNRWGTVDPSGAPRTAIVDWLGTVAAAGFDGLELWERHLPTEPDARAALVDGPLPVTVLNTYATFGDDDPMARVTAANSVVACKSEAVKFNVGPDAEQLDRYVERTRAWLELLPPTVTLLCECHAGTAIADDPVAAASFLDAVGEPERVQAIVHTHEDAEGLRVRFDAYGERITHVHVNYLDLATLSAPPLADQRADLASKAALLHELGFAGSWTIEFVHGLLTDHDEPGPLLEQATTDLAVLRSVLAGPVRP